MPLPAFATTTTTTHRECVETRRFLFGAKESFAEKLEAVKTARSRMTKTVVASCPIGGETAKVMMEEEEKHMRMLQVRNMQNENRFVEVVEEGEKQEGEVIVIEDERCGGTRSQQVLLLSPGGDMISSEEENYLDIPGVVLFINFKVYATVSEVEITSLSIIESDCFSGIRMGWSGRRCSPESVSYTHLTLPTTPYV